MEDPVPPKVYALDQIDTDSIEFVRDSRGYREIRYKDQALYVQLPRMRSPKGVTAYGAKRYLTLSADSAAFATLQHWLDCNGDGDVQPIVRDGIAKIRMRIEDDEFVGGVFDAAAQPAGIDAIVPKAHLQCIVQITAVWEMGGPDAIKSGLLIDAMQVLVEPTSPDCKIVADDDPYVPFQPRTKSPGPSRSIAACQIVDD